MVNDIREMRGINGIEIQVEEICRNKLVWDITETDIQS